MISFHSICILSHGKRCPLAVWHCHCMAATVFLYVVHRRSGGCVEWCGCFLKSLRPSLFLHRPSVWTEPLCRWPCWVATRWQPAVQTGWLNGLSPWWGLVHSLRRTGPLLKQIKPFIDSIVSNPSLIDTWSENFTLGIVCLTLQMSSLSVLQT